MADSEISIQVYIFTAPRRSEMDNGMEQAVRDMPHIEVLADGDDLFREVLSKAIAAADQSLEAIRYYQRNVWAYYVAVPPVDGDDSEALPWTDMGHQQSNDGYFGVSTDGLLVIDDGTFARATLGDLVRGSTAGYTHGKWTKLVLVAPVGLGGGSPVLDLIQFLEEHGVDIALVVLPWLAHKLRSRFVTARAKRRIRDLAEAWNRGGIKEPWMLRNWFDTKSAWTDAEIAKRLRLPRRNARQLLRALGYERHPGSDQWSLGMSLQARKNRKGWINTEWGGPY